MSQDEDREASVAAQAIDSIVAGEDAHDRSADPAVIAARRIRASLNPPRLDGARRAAIAETVMSQWAWRRRRRTMRTVLAIAATVLVVVLLSLLYRPDMERIPVHQRSRETATLIRGPFPPNQTASDRIDLIYADRLDGLREATLFGALP